MTTQISLFKRDINSKTYICRHIYFLLLEAGQSVILHKTRLDPTWQGFVMFYSKVLQGQILFLTPISVMVVQVHRVFIKAPSLGQWPVEDWNLILTIFMLAIGVYKLIHPLAGLVFHPVRLHATFLTNRSTKMRTIINTKIMFKNCINFTLIFIIIRTIFILKFQLSHL